MSSCNYRILQDIYTDFDADLKDIAAKIEAIDVNLNVDELDIDLDELTEQITISNKLKLLELVGTDVMTEEEQLAAYTAIKTKLFSSDGPHANAPDPMEEEEGEW